MEYHDAVADALVSGARSYIDTALEPLLARIAVLEARAPVEPVGISEALRSADGRLLLTLTNGRVLDAGLVNGADGKDADPVDPSVLRGMVVAAVALIPPVNPAEIVSALRGEVEVGLRQFVSELVTALPPARDGVDGKDADPAVMQRLVIAEVSRQVEALPPPRDGVDGIAGKDGAPGEAGERGPPGIDGKDGAHGKDGVDGKDGIDGKDGAPGEAGADGRHGIDGKDGQDGVNGRDGVDGKDGGPGEVGEMGRTGEKGADGAAGEDGRDGIGLTGAIIDRSGRLVLTLSDGSLRELGEIVGRDGKDADMEVLADIIVREVQKMPTPRDGVDGLGFDEMDVLHDGERTVTFRLSRGDMVKDFPMVIPAIIDRGVWEKRRYAKGDGVTWDGSFFIAQVETEGQPLVSKDWRQAVKAGRPGRVETVKVGPTGPVKDNGKA